ncbi:MAG: tryptophanase [Myxococcaceae bacterium]|nr:tryptophanase [Myxococcaceae bacterium]
MPRPIIEPFRIKVVEPIHVTDGAQRALALEKAHYNLFGLAADEVMIDLLTDSGTGAMSAEQWAAMMRGDESYAGANSFFRLQEVTRALTGMPYIFPTHQGRAAERILCDALALKGQVVLSNGLFDTTRANIEAAGATGIDLAAADALVSRAPFAGDMDLAAFDKALQTHRGRVAMVVMTVTNNTVGGLPVSLRNMEEVAQRCREQKLFLVLDACRFAENAYRVFTDEPAIKKATLEATAQAFFSLADAFTMSAKKDAIVNIGGLLGVRDEALAERIRVELIRTEGFVTYGGLAGRDLDAMAQGLREVLNADYLAYRFAASSYLANGLSEAGWPVVLPAAAHAVYVDAGAALAHLPADHFPGQSLACALYLSGGIRSCEIGDLMFGAANGRRQLVRLALPRRVYTQSHVDYVAAVSRDVAAVKRHLPGLRVVSGPKSLRHFSAQLLPLAPFPRALIAA